MTMTDLLPSIRQLSSSEKLDLIRILAEELNTTDLIINRTQNRPVASAANDTDSHSLQGSVINYIDPTAPIDTEDWDALK